MAFTVDSSLGQLLDDPQAKAVIDQYLPGLSTNPMVAMVRGMSLKMILSMPQAAQFGITQEKVDVILAEVNRMSA